MQALVMLEPQQGLTYDALLHVARTARDLGMEGTFRSDHYQSLWGPPDDDPATDAWATLAGLARDVADGVIGTLVSPVTFRHPAELAKVVATVSHMSAGPRIELGLGTGWNEAEHRAYGFPFGTLGDRFGILEEYVQVVKGILSGEEFSFEGRHYTVEKCVSRPAAAEVRIVIGGRGERRTPRLAALHADELNVTFMTPEEVAGRVQACRRFLEDAGRDPDAFRFSWMGPFLLGRDDADLRDRAGRLGSVTRRSPDDVLGSHKGRSPVGTVSEGADFLESLAEVGISRVMLQHLATDDDDHLALAAEAASAASVG